MPERLGEAAPEEVHRLAVKNLAAALIMFRTVKVVNSPQEHPSAVWPVLGNLLAKVTDMNPGLLLVNTELRAFFKISQLVQILAQKEPNFIFTHLDGQFLPALQQQWQQQRKDLGPKFRVTQQNGVEALIDLMLAPEAWG